MNEIRLRLRVAKAPIALMTSFSALAGTAAAGSVFQLESAIICLGTFLLVCGAGSLNSFQDRHMDAMFQRTRNRPLPQHQLTARQAQIQAACLILSGLIVSYAAGFYLSVPLTGLAALVLYNGLYTPMKPKTQLALIPGAVCGMLPPLMGFLAVGGQGFPLKIILLMILVGVWQFPHFWMTLLIHSKDYEASDMPTMLTLFSEKQLTRMIFLWVAGFAFLTLLLPLYNLVQTPWTKALLLLNATGLVIMAGKRIAKCDHTACFSALARYVNASIGVVLALIIVDSPITIV